jgi:solute carrier family 25 carnitine/acylcarnitine transporter 20/29
MIQTFSLRLLVVLVLLSVSRAFYLKNGKSHYSISYKKEISSIRLNALVENALIPLAAGAISGAIGVGASYPVDTIKTKSQAYATSRVAGDNTQLGLLEIIKMVLKNEGVKGFYGGVLGVMIGQAFIKSSAFASNAWALSILNSSGGEATILQLALAAAFSGFVASFVVNPIERIKVLMQADSCGLYSSEIECMNNVIQNDGVQGLVVRGLDATLSREVPGYALYFMAYSLLMRSPIGAENFGTLAPLLCGASAGCLSWLPVYPIDVVKT